MQNSTFQNLKRALLLDVDTETLTKQRKYESPFIQFQIDMLLHKDKLDASRIYAASFSNIKEISKKSRDEVVVTYILFLANIVKYEKLNRTFLRPGAWIGECAWTQTLKIVTYCVITLIYDIKWNSNYFFHLDFMISELLQGKADAVRNFFQKLKIQSFTSTPFPIERDVEMLQFQNTDDFGPYYWRLLHWMAEAFNMRHGHDDVQLAKSLWQDFVSKVMYRTLRCMMCINHYQMITHDLKDRLMNSNNYPKLWFDIHNIVRKSQNKPVYTLEEFEKDSQAMKSVLQA
ncbi:hypothetical protein HNY73_001038 [Argiope bruennichi]|uniref:Sulfhydryl oxidase n=1 Tax=Argiope bruennichi TaxID=94029 RepID=A0A8T0G146_ARGBR|nr:hypothetical protein HNY73_001038 [Argiope bruennichi]